MSERIHTSTSPTGRDRDLQPVHVPDEWLDDFEASDEARQLGELTARIRGDVQLLAWLADCDYDGPDWDVFASALAAYGYAVLAAWIATGEIFRKCRARGWNRGAFVEAEDAGWRQVCNRHDREDLLQETVATAIFKFRDNVLRPGRWDPNGGASLKTFFIGQAIIQFPDIFERWWRAHPMQVLRWFDRRRGLPEFEVELEIDAMDAVMNLDPTLAHILVYRQAGYSSEEIAELTGLSSAHAVDQRVYRHRQDPPERNTG